MRKYLWAVPVLGAVWFYFALKGMFGYIPLAHLDLEVYRFGVDAWWHGQDMYGRLPVVDNGAELPFVYPPFAALILSPLAVLPWSPAVATLYTVNVACLAVTLYLVSRVVWPALGRLGGIAAASLALPLTVFGEPVIQTFEFGQVSLIMMALVSIDCLAGKTLWPRGFGIGLAAAIKLTPAAFVLFFLVRKDYRAAVTAGITWAAATAIGFVADWGGSLKYWFGGLAGGAGVSGSAFRTNQTIEAVLVRTGLPESVTKPLWIVLVLALLTLVANAMRRSEPALALVANAGLALLISPTSWSHYYVWVVPALVVMAGYAVRRWRERSAAAAGWVGAFVLTAVIFKLAPFHDLPVTDFPNVQVNWTPSQQLSAASYVLVGVVLLLAYALPRQRDEPAVTVPPPKQHVLNS